MSQDSTDSAGLVRVIAYFDPDTAPAGTVGSESFWATPLPDHPATNGSQLAVRIDNLLVWAPFTLGDIALVTLNDDERLQVIALLERTACTSIGVLVRYDDADPAGEAAAGLTGGQIASACREHGARTERFGPTAVSIQLPAGILEDDDSVDAWIDEVIGGLVDNAPAGLSVGFDVTHAPSHPLAIAWLDTDLAQALPDETWYGHADLAWDAGGDPAFTAALDEARTEGHVPDWASDTQLAQVATDLWRRDSRVRSAIAARRHRSVAIYAFRVSAPTGTVLPPLDGPLL